MAITIQVKHGDLARLTPEVIEKRKLKGTMSFATADTRYGGECENTFLVGNGDTMVAVGTGIVDIEDPDFCAKIKSIKELYQKAFDGEVVFSDELDAHYTKTEIDNLLAGLGLDAIASDSAAAKADAAAALLEAASAKTAATQAQIASQGAATDAAEAMTSAAEAATAATASQQSADQAQTAVNQAAASAANAAAEAQTASTQATNASASASQAETAAQAASTQATAAAQSATVAETNSQTAESAATTATTYAQTASTQAMASAESATNAASAAAASAQSASQAEASANANAGKITALENALAALTARVTALEGGGGGLDNPSWTVDFIEDTPGTIEAVHTFTVQHNQPLNEIIQLREIDGVGFTGFKNDSEDPHVYIDATNGPWRFDARLLGPITENRRLIGVWDQ
jgi:hypothetical protein